MSDNPFAGHTFRADRGCVFVEPKDKIVDGKVVGSSMGFHVCEVNEFICEREAVARAIAAALNAAAQTDDKSTPQPST